jgi:DNA polymerase III delta prime subunit
MAQSRQSSFTEMSSSLQISYTEDGLEAIVFTAQGDMRQALNNLQSTVNGFKHVSSENVFKVTIAQNTELVQMKFTLLKFVLSQVTSVTVVSIETVAQML